MRSRFTVSLLLVILLGASSSCAERQSPFEPLPVPSKSSALVLPPSVIDQDLDQGSDLDPSKTLNLPTYAEMLIAEFRFEGVTDVQALHVHRSSFVVDGGGYFHSGNNQFYAHVTFRYTYGIWGPARGNPPVPLRVDTVLIQGTGTVTRSGAIPQNSYDCPGAPACWSYNADQKFSITPLFAEISLTAVGRPELAPGVIELPGPVYTTFKIGSTPVSFKSIPVPIRVLSWQWIAAGGGSGQTYFTGFPTNVQRTVYLAEPGSMIVTAFVNGVEQVDTIEVIRPETQITLQKESMLPSVRYTKIRGGAVNNPSSQVLSVSVLGPTGPISNRSVTLTLLANEGTAGHLNHPANAKPKGAFRTGGTTIQLNTGVTGIDTVTFVAPDPSGPVTITGASSNAVSDTAMINVEVPGLVRLPLSHPTYDTTGGTTIHPDNHHVTPNHLGYLFALADGFLRVTNKKLVFNDSSLELGGLFDNVRGDGFWTYPHRTHRFGTETDLKTQNHPISANNLSDRDKRMIRWLWETQYGGRAEPEGDHWHLIIK